MIAVYKKVVAVFKSRSQVMSFIESMNAYGVPCKSVSTPKEARIGCGVSAEFSPSHLSRAKEIINRGRYNSFHGLYLIEKRGTRTTTVRI